jgi:hypothetical protein
VKAWGVKSASGRALQVLAGAAAVSVVIALQIPVCPTATLFGIPCPGCGLTRATLALFRGDVAAALKFHPLVFVLTPLVVGLTLNSAYQYVRGPRPTENPGLVTSRAASLAAAVLLVGMLGVWGARFLGYFGGPVPVERLHLHALGTR